jgi:two-component system chemotaxis response regulator CheB
LLRERCAIEVKEAEDKELIRPATVYVAPPDYHLLVEQNRSLSLSSEEPVNYCRPAVDILFETAADAYGPGLVAVVLTGANADGARGSLAVQNAGGVVLVQRPEQAYAPEMPRAALAACPEACPLSLNEIAEFLRDAGGRA